MADRDHRRGEEDDESRMRRRVFEEMEENRDARTRRAFNTAGYGDQGPAGVGRVDPSREDEVRRLNRGWERVQRDGFDADRDPERIRDRDGERGGGGGRGSGTGLGELYGQGFGGEERARARSEEYRHRPREQGRGGEPERGGYPPAGLGTHANEGGQRPRGGDHRGRGPRGYKRSDRRIEEDVNERLTEDPRIDATEVRVEIKDGEVTLSGTVESREERRRAEDIAEAVSGVTYVLNNLRVRQPGGAGYVG